MSHAMPIGSICSYAGQVNPVSGAPNAVWGTTDCGARTPDTATPADAPLNHLEAEGWMLCDGRYLGIDTYPELFATLGYLYGQRSAGIGQFAIPDCRGLFLRGFDGGSGMDPEAAERTSPRGDGVANSVGSLQCGALQEHTHDYNRVLLSGISNQGPAAGTQGTLEPSGQPNSPALTGAETRPKNIAVNYIIRFR